MGKFQNKKLTTKRTFAKNTWYDWYEWLINSLREKCPNTKLFLVCIFLTP